MNTLQHLSDQELSVVCGGVTLIELLEAFVGDNQNAQQAVLGALVLPDGSLNEGFLQGILNATGLELDP